MRTINWEGLLNKALMFVILLAVATVAYGCAV